MSMSPDLEGRSLELMYQNAAAFAAACEQTALRSLVVWNCKVRDFSPLARLTKLTDLTVFRYRGTLDVLAALTGLRRLQLVDIPEVRSLAPLASLSQLQVLSLEAMGGNPLTERTIRVDSLSPLTRLARLRELTLMRISVAKGGLKPLSELPRLRTFDCSNIFPMEEVAWLAGRRPKLRGCCLEACIEMPLDCGKCGAKKVRLNGRGRQGIRLLCPTCQARRFGEHVAEFERLVIAARRAGGKRG